MAPTQLDLMSPITEGSPHLYQLRKKKNVCSIVGKRINAIEHAPLAELIVDLVLARVKKYEALMLMKVIILIQIMACDKHSSSS